MTHLLCCDVFVNVNYIGDVTYLIDEDDICCFFFCCFFFQAEDGIRDHCVTGSDVCSADLVG